MIFERQSTNKWITSGIMNSCKKKKDLYLLVKSNNDENLKNYYLRYCKILANIIKTAKKLYFKNKITHAHNKVKVTWNIIKSNVGKNNNGMVIDNMDVNNKVSSSKINAEKFNDYFIKMAVNISEKIKNKNKLNTNNTNYSPFNLAQFYNLKYNNIKLHNTSTGEILKIIKNFAWKNSQGFDEIPLKLLKISAPFIASPLCYIINKSLSAGIFPDRMKYSIIVPLHKKGDTKNVANFRPISLLLSFSKIFEKVVYKRLLKHFQDNNILSNDQFGFRNNSSTTNAIFKLTNIILSLRGVTDLEVI
jgi:Notch-like protein